MKWVVSLWKYCPTSTTIITLKGTICYFSDTNYVKDNDIYCSYISTQVMGIWPKWKHITLNLTAAEYVWQNKNPGKMLLVSTLLFVTGKGERGIAGVMDTSLSHFLNAVNLNDVFLIYI